MAVNEMTLVLWRISGSVVPPTAGGLWFGDVDPTSLPELFSRLVDGWSVTSHTIVGVGDGSGDLLLTLFLTRPVEVPDSLADA